MRDVQRWRAALASRCARRSRCSPSSRHGRRARAVLIVALDAAGALAGVAPGTAGDCDDPFFLNWPTFLPAVGSDFTASTENDRPTGSVKCVENVVKEMTAARHGRAREP